MWLYERPIAHRGLHNEMIPENSEAAFKKAIEHNYYIETDVRLLADGEVVVFHDETLERICGKNIKVKNLTTEDIKGDKYLLPNGEHIMLFKELLELIEGKTKLLLELKYITFLNCNLEKAVYKLIKGKEASIAIQSFDPVMIMWFKKHAPEFKRGLLATKVRRNYLNPLMELMIDFSIKRANLDFLSFNILYLPSEKISKIIDENKMKFITWTIKTEEGLKLAKITTADNIIFESIVLENGKYQ